MKESFFPLIWARFVIISHGQTIFSIDNKRLVIKAPDKLMREVVELCNGKVSIMQIIEALKKKWDENSLISFFNDLSSSGVVIDASKISDQIWKFIGEPIGFPIYLSKKKKICLVEKAKKRNRKEICDNVYFATETKHIDLLERRRSIRSFSGQVSFQSIVNMLWSCYGEVGNARRTVPSAGALYPLTIHIVLLQETEGFCPGVYRIFYGDSRSVKFEMISLDLNPFKKSLVDPMILKNAHGAIVISGSFCFTAEKYGSRSISFTILEAGHAAQNINISAVEQNIATVEVGGFKEAFLKNTLCLQKNCYPLLVTVFGQEDFKEKTPEECIETQWHTFEGNRIEFPFFAVSARVSENRDWSHGRGGTPEEAYVKAMAEAKEWAACEASCEDIVFGRFVDFENVIDPRDVIKFHPKQYLLKNFPFKQFNNFTSYGWTKGHDEISGFDFCVLADHVYFPYFPKTPYYCYANSSGVAAHPNKQKAIELSTLELIERDSFMIAYLTRIKFPTVKTETLPETIRKRMQALKKIGFQVYIKDHSIDFAPVIGVYAQSNDLSCTICASCSSFDIEYAISHALMEVESSVMARIQNFQVSPIKPTEVNWPLDHGRLYEQKEYFRNADFLIHYNERISFDCIGRNVAKSWDGLVNRVSEMGSRLITVPLSLSRRYGDNGGLHIIRSILPGLVPMTFGFRQEAAGMKRIYTIFEKMNGRSISYKDLTKFPHPFA